jgi:hypothetical protein
MSRVTKTRSGGVAFLAACICLLVSVCAAPAFATEPSVPKSGLPLPPSVMPVIVLQGSDYNMGYQYSQQINQLFGPSILKAMQKPAGFSEPQLVALKAYQWYVQQNTPELIDMFKGMAAAATDAGVPLSYTEVLAYYVGTRGYPGTEPDGSGSQTLPPSCSHWAAWGKTTTDGGLISGQAMDPPSGEFASYVAIVAYPTTGNAYVNVTSPGQLSSIPVYPGINNKGVSTGGNSGEGWRMVDRGVAGYNVKAGLILHMLRFSDSAAAAKDIWLSYHQTGSWNVTISDVNGNAFVVESTGAFQNVRKPGDFGEGSFIYSRNNYFTDEGGKANLNGSPGKFYPHGGWALDPTPGADDPGNIGDVQMASVRTNQTMYNMLHRYAGHIDINFAEMFFRFTGQMPRDPWDIKDFRATKAKYYETPGNLNDGFVTISKPANGNSGVMYVCTGPAGRVASPYEAGPADDCYQIAGTHTFFTVALDASPTALVADAQFAAKRDIAWAYQRLMWKNYGDVGFEGLNVLFSEANTEYAEGANWVSLSRTATGNEKVLDTSNAATCFANAQAHAQQIYEALVRPATTPSGLGLAPYLAFQYGF